MMINLSEGWREMIGTLGSWDFKIVLHNLGKVLSIASSAFILPLAGALYFGEGEQVRDFLIAFLSSLGFGFFLWVVFRSEVEIKMRHAIAVTALSYPLLAFFSSIPLLKVAPSFLDAYFEAMSGWTTTGLSTLRSIEDFPLSINLWRHFMQYLGGLGIIVLSLIVLSRAGTGIEVTSFYAAEGRSTKIGVNILGTVRAMWVMYFGLLLLGALAFYLAGMNAFDSFCHSMSGFSTGGFSTHSQSIGYFQSHWIEVVAVVIMLLGSINFPLLHNLLSGNLKEMVKNIENKTFFLIFALLCLSTVLLLSPTLQGIRLGIFHSASSLTTTGWSNSTGVTFFPLVQLLLIFGMIIGASAGSTGGGIKRLRAAMVFKSIWWDIKKDLSPEDAIIPRKFHHFKERNAEEKTVYRMYIMVASYVLLLVFSASATAGWGYPLGDAFFESSSAVGTVGLSTGIVGAELPTPLKLIYILDMWAGRLEVLPVLMFFVSLKGLLIR